jgi:hypothetical protein
MAPLLRLWGDYYSKLVKITTNVWKKVTKSTIKSGFRKAGIFPFNPDVVLNKIRSRERAANNLNGQDPDEVLELARSIFYPNNSAPARPVQSQNSEQSPPAPPAAITGATAEPQPTASQPPKKKRINLSGKVVTNDDIIEALEKEKREKEEKAKQKEENRIKRDQNKERKLIEQAEKKRKQEEKVIILLKSLIFIRKSIWNN